jgi:anti-anti-sigma regulatory factor
MLEQWSEEIILVTLEAEPDMAKDILALQQKLEDNEQQDVVIDFSRVDIITGGNLTQLLKTKKRIADCGKRLVLCNIAPTTKGIFTVMGYDDIFDVMKDKSVALVAIFLQ